VATQPTVTAELWRNVHNNTYQLPKEIICGAAVRTIYAHVCPLAQNDASAAALQGDSERVREIYEKVPQPPALCANHDTATCVPFRI